jgi:hypothetical protein
MDDHITAINQNPVAVFRPFDGDPLHADLLQFFAEMIGHRAYLANAVAGGDHHEIGDAALARQVDGGDVDGLVVIERR